MINLEIQRIIINFRNDAGHYRKLILNYFTLKSIGLSPNPRKYIPIAITFFRCRKKQLLSDCRQLVPDCLLFSKKKHSQRTKNTNKPPRSWERTCYIGQKIVLEKNQAPNNNGTNLQQLLPNRKKQEKVRKVRINAQLTVSLAKTMVFIRRHN